MNFPAEKLYRIAISALLLLVLANALAAGLRTVSDTDMGWHLATGRYVVQHHSVPSTDVLSYTAAGTPWIYPPFAGVLLYLIYAAAGYTGLSYFCMLACLATVAYLARKRDLASLLLAMCAVEPIAFRTGARADLFNTVFFAFFFGELWAFHRGSSKRLWLLPLIIFFWVNLHPGFILGLAAIGAYLLLEASDLPFAQRRGAAWQRLRTAWPWLAGTAAVTLLNPWGPKLYLASFSLAGLRGEQQGGFNTSALIGEFLSVPVSSHLLRQLVDFRHPENGYTWLMLFALLIIALALWQKQVGVAFIQAAALYLSLQHARYIGLFCVATCIIGATVLREAFATHSAGSPADAAQSPPRPRSLGGPFFKVPIPFALAFAVAICAITLLHTADFVSNRIHVLFRSESRFGSGEASWFPEHAAAFIRREHLPGNIFHEYGLGGFAAWRLGPEYPDFIDGRFDHLAPAVLVEERRLLSQSPDSPVWQEAADRWGINVLLILEAEPRAADRQDALGFCQSKSWRPVYMDEVSLVLVRNIPANRPWIDRLAIDCHTQELLPPRSASRKELYDFYINSGGLLYALQRDRDSEAALLQAAALYPEDPNARLMLGELYHRRRMFDRAEAEYLASLALNQSDRPWFELGLLYVEERRLPEAAQAFSRAAQLSVTPCIPYLSLAQVELLLQQPDQALRAYGRATETSPYRNGAEAQAPKLYAEIAEGRSDAHRMLNHLPQAIQFQEEAVRLDPTVPGQWNRLADLLAASGQMERSQQARDRAQALQLNAGQ